MIFNKVVYSIKPEDMKWLLFSILIFTVHLPIYAQVEIENLFESINWNNTEPEFILKFHNCIEKKSMKNGRVRILQVIINLKI